MKATEMTPAEVARAVLDSIGKEPHSFDMTTWFSESGNAAVVVLPGENLCGTAACAAGWAAHVTGWELRCDYRSGPVPVHGRYGMTDEVVWAEKDGERWMIPVVAESALGLCQDEGFWEASPDQAITNLLEIADGK